MDDPRLPVEPPRSRQISTGRMAEVPRIGTTGIGAGCPTGSNGVMVMGRSARKRANSLLRRYLAC